MRKRKILTILPWLLFLAAVMAHYAFDPWGFYRKVSSEEAQKRLQYVQTAERWLGTAEGSDGHRTLLDIYNTQEQLPQDYPIQEGDSWCAAFVSTAALEAGLDGVIPMECSCERQIGLWQQLSRWVEDDNAVPLPGDLIYYNWDQKKPGENSGWSDHVGIVVGTKWPFVKTIEGNYDDQVKYRILPLWDIRIRGYGEPDFCSSP